MKLDTYIVLFFVICFCGPALTQDPIRQNEFTDSLRILPGLTDSLSETMSLFGDSTIVIPISDQTIDGEIEHGAVDTQWVDVVNNQIHLIGEAYVKYQGNEIKAGYIIFDFEKKEAFAQSVKGRDGEDVGVPTFKTEGQEFQYKKMKFNFETQKGIVYEAFSQQGEYFIHGAVTKFVSKAGDSLFVDDVVFNKNSLITTCNHPNPHYGIRSSKLKLIPDKLAVIGPSRLEIGGIPTPLFIPFAFMPMIQGSHSGIIFGGQQGFEFSEQLGFGFREIGYYWALNDYMDLKVTGDIYSRGSYGIRLASNYAKRYKFRGNLQLGYSTQFSEVEGVLERNANRSFTFGLTHNQDSKAHPYMTIGGNFRFTTNDFDRNNYNDAQSQLENIINSNFRISHKLPSIDALSLNITIGHSQNTRTRKIDFTLPNVELRMKTIYPFKRKQRSGKEKWFEKLNVSYNSALKNFVSTQDTILFKQETLENFQTGMSHTAQAGAAFNILEHFQLSPSVNYEEYWVLKTLEREFAPHWEISRNAFTNELDSTRIVVEDVFNGGFARYNNIRSSLNLSTNLFGTVLFKKGKIRGIRHTIKPSIGLTFTPSTERFIKTVRTSETDSLLMQEYTEFDGGIFRAPNPGEKQMAMTYSITNLFEGKYYSKKDSTEKKFKVFNNINIGGNHNFVADSLKWSVVSMRGNASLFGRISNLTFSATFDPYIEQNNRRVNQTVWGERKRPVRFERFSSTLSTRFSVKDIREFFQKRKDKKEEENDEDLEDENLLLDQMENEMRNQPFGSSQRDQFGLDPEREQNTERERNLEEGENPDEGEKPEISIWDMLDRFTINHVIEYRVQANDDVKESSIRTNSLRMSGKIPLTDFWDVNVGNFSYDFVNKSFVYPSIGFSRDLHCWNMRFDWQPARGTFNFFIAVKSSQLGGFLKYNYGRTQYDRIF